MAIVNGFEDTIEWYNKNASAYSNAARKLSVSFAIDKFASFLPSGAKVFDAGSGSGRDSNILAKKGFEVIGVDISRGLVEQSTKEYPGIKFLHGDIRKLDFPSQIFDAVWAQASLVHFDSLEDAKKSIKEFARVLKPGGILHVMVKEKIDNDRTKITKDKISNHDRFFIYFNSRELEDILLENNFKIILIKNKIPDPAKRKNTMWIWSLAQKQESLL